MYLKGGGRLSGRIVSRTGAAVEVDVGAGRIAVPASSVVCVEEGHSPLHEYEDRAGRIGAGDADAWAALGEWADSQGLGTQGREAYHRAPAASPDDPRANAALGNLPGGLAADLGRPITVHAGRPCPGAAAYSLARPARIPALTPV